MPVFDVPNVVIAASQCQPVLKNVVNLAYWMEKKVEMRSIVSR